MSKTEQVSKPTYDELVAKLSELEAKLERRKSSRSSLEFVKTITMTRNNNGKRVIRLITKDGSAMNVIVQENNDESFGNAIETLKWKAVSRFTDFNETTFSEEISRITSKNVENWKKLYNG